MLYKPFIYEYLAQWSAEYSQSQVRSILCRAGLWGALAAFDASGDCLHLCTISKDYILKVWYEYVNIHYIQRRHPLKFSFKKLIIYKAEGYSCLSCDDFETAIAQIPPTFFEKFEIIKSWNSEYEAFEHNKNETRRSRRIKKQRKH